ncbi:SPX domain-containing protein [Halteromyces radiatus]|uniref:SPX domain-containing protein n=1 Tax=Halteromyces radiatus TaxID=101107 RepID=UPI00222104D8|nr:SPX domain-containing protein [Halteromyces radiatus]KAI8097179.1 SPX domain-containing protein [Halteromyces radiatus]
MKFAKQLETESESIPSEWRPYLIQYKKLKKLIAKVADEIEKHGMSVSMLHDCLDNSAERASSMTTTRSPNINAPQVQYYFTGEAPNIRPCIRFTYDSSNTKVMELLSNLINDQDKTSERIIDKTTCSTKDKTNRGPLEYQRSQDNTDFFTLSRIDTDGDSDEYTTHSVTDDDNSISHSKNDNSIPSSIDQSAPLISSTSSSMVPSHMLTPDNSNINNTLLDGNRRRSSAARVLRDLTELTLKKEGQTKSPGQMRSLVVELEQDDEFFYMLMTELQSAVHLQHKASNRFEADINELEKRMVKIASPNQKSDMYAWRKIFSIYMDAQIFQGKMESDRSMHSVQKAKQQMSWFTTQLQRENLISKLKNGASKSALQQFMALNTELITMKHYQALNQTAMTKILKKHDKRSGLTASTSFPDFVGSSQFFTPTLAKLLCAAIVEKITTIIPQPDDYSCPVCMSIAWRPIRLVCGHVFCVRCLIKAQKKHMDSCPMCRHPTAVQTASALNLDEPLQNFLLMYFPKEIKQKKRENEREQAIEDVEAFTGRTFSPDQIARMNRDNHQNCTIM